MTNSSVPEQTPSMVSTPQKEIFTQIQQFDNIPLQHEVLNANPCVVVILNSMR